MGCAATFTGWSQDTYTDLEELGRVFISSSGGSLFDSLAAYTPYTLYIIDLEEAPRFCRESARTTPSWCQQNHNPFACLVKRKQMTCT